jgi:hypothetical protein
MGRRVYEAAVDTIAIGTAVQDIFAVDAGASNGVQLHWIQCTAASITTAAQLRLRLKRGAATITAGSAGTAPTINKVDDGDTKAAGSVVRANDTTQQTAAFANLKYFQWNVLLPFDYMPGPEDEDRDTCLVSESLVLDLPATITATTISQFITFREWP